MAMFGGGARSRMAMTPVDQSPDIIDLLAMNGAGGGQPQPQSPQTGALQMLLQQLASAGGAGGGAPGGQMTAMGAAPSPMAAGGALRDDATMAQPPQSLSPMPPPMMVDTPQRAPMPYLGIGPGVDGDPLSRLKPPGPQLTAPRLTAPLEKPRGLFGSMNHWLSTPNANGYSGGDGLSAIGATLKDVAAGLAGRDGDAVQGWSGGIADRQLADAMNAPMLGPNGKPVTPLQRMQALQQLAIKAGSRGGHTQNFMAMLPGMRDAANEQNYLGTVPQKDQAVAAMDPLGYAKFDLGRRNPKVENVSPGGAIVVIDPVTNMPKVVYQGATKPEAITPDRIIGTVLQKYQSGQKLTPEEQAIYNRWQNGTDGNGQGGGVTPSRVLGSVLAKVQSGGVESLSPGEKNIWDRYNRNNDPFASFMGGAGAGSYDDEGGMGLGAPPPGAGGGAPGARPGPAANANPPPQALQSLKPGQETTFQNGQTWTVRNGKPVRVR